MKTSVVFSTLLVIGCCLLFSQEANASGVYGYTSIDYDEASNTVDAYSETDLDGDLVYEYSAKITLTVTDQSANIIGSDSMVDTSTQGYAYVELTFSGVPDSTYTAVGAHKAVANLWSYDDGCVHRSCSILYWDDFNFSTFESDGIYQPWYYYFLSPFYNSFARHSPVITVGTTYDYDYVSTPGAPTLKISCTNASGYIDHTTKNAMLGATIPLTAVVVSGNGSGGAWQWQIDDTNSGANSASFNAVITSLGKHKVSVTYNASTGKGMASVTVNVIVPKITVTTTSASFSGTLLQPWVSQGSNCISLIDFGYYLHTGCPFAGAPGMDFDAYVDNQGAYISNVNESRLKIVQLAGTNTTRTNSASGACERLSTTGWMLDATDPYGAPADPATGPIENGSLPNIATNDSPAQPLATGYNYSVNDSFLTYLVYFTGTDAAPANQKAIGVIAWTWGGSTTYSVSGSPPHVAVAGSLSPTSNSKVFNATSLIPTNEGTGIVEYSPTTIQSFSANTANWHSCN